MITIEEAVYKVVNDAPKELENAIDKLATSDPS